MAAANQVSSTPAQSEKLATYLDKVKQDAMIRMKSGGGPVVLVMGNEAGDTDSMASAILLSYFLNQNKASQVHLPENTVFAPLLQHLRRDLRLRGENEMLLHLLGVDPLQLLFLDDLPNDRSGLLRPGIDVYLALTDHPKLSRGWEPYEEFSQKVVAVVDHHADEDSHTNAPLRVLMGPGKGQVGSATSVVLEIFTQGSAQQQNIGKELADLALAAILIDTDDLRPLPLGKATEVDITTASYLLPQSSIQDSSSRKNLIDSAIKFGGKTAQSAASTESSFFTKSQSSSIDNANVDSGLDVSSLHSDPAEAVLVRTGTSTYWSILSAVKLDVDRLSSSELLRRDYKENVDFDLPSAVGSNGNLRCGFSSVPVGLSDWVRKEGEVNDQMPTRWEKYWSTINEFMKERKLDIAVVGTSFRDDGEEMEGRAPGDGKHRRELIFAFRPPRNGPSLFRPLLSSLQSDSYANTLPSPDSSLSKLLLEEPWKGRRMASTGKRERVSGLEESGKWAKGKEELWIAVFIQRNARASRKMYLPAVMHAIRTAAQIVVR